MLRANGDRPSWPWWRVQGVVVNADEWPVLLAREFAPHEELIADEIARRFAKGGRPRKAVLGVRGGERTGGLGAEALSGDLAQLLDVLRVSAAALLAVLEHPAVDGASGVGALVASLIQWRQTHQGSEAGPVPLDVKVTIETTVEVSPELIDPVDHALKQTADEMVERGSDPGGAWERAGALLQTLLRHPLSAAAFVRWLDRSSRRSRRNKRRLGSRRSARRSRSR
jgi:hypothetical protein